MNVIPKERVDSLFNTKVITKAEYDEIIENISDRVHHIWSNLCKMNGRQIEWYAFSNDIEDHNGNGITGGHFDPYEHKDWIELIGDFDRIKAEEYIYNDGFPTKYLWTQDDKWKAEVIENYEYSINKAKLDKEAKKNGRLNLKNKKEEMKNIIKSKLTKEELKFIKFK